MSSAAADEFDVVVIGSGLAGLNTAHNLKKHRPDLRVIVVEAHSRWIGGRLRTMADNPALAPIHLGAELIHGTNTSVARLVQEQKFETRPLFHWAHGDGGPSDWPVGGKVGYYYVGPERRMIRFDDGDREFEKLNAALAKIMDHHTLPEGDKTTVGEFLQAQGVSPIMVDMAESGYANSLCCPIRELSLRETAQLEKIMEYEDKDGWDLKIDGSVARIVDFLRKGIKVVNGWPVAKVDTTGRSSRLGCTVTARHGAVIHCRAVVSAVPLSIYHRRDIEFNPPLPSPIQSTLDRLRFDPALKVFLSFTEPFWPSDTQGVICAGAPCPEFWFQPRMARAPEDYDAAFTGASSPAPYLVTLFATNDAARGLTSLTDEHLLKAILGQLDEMYASDANPKPATRAFHSWLKYDWAKADFVHGGYSSPTAGVTMAHRRALWGPHHEGRLFLCGEHTSPSFASMHGALDTGETVAAEVSKAIPASALRPKL